MDLALGRGSRVPVTSPYIRTHAAQVPRRRSGTRPSPQWPRPPSRVNRGEEGGKARGASGGTVRERVHHAKGRAERAPGLPQAQESTRHGPARPAHEREPRPMQHRYDPVLQGTLARVRAQTLTGSRLAARGPGAGVGTPGVSCGRAGPVKLESRAGVTSPHPHHAVVGCAWHAQPP